MQKKIAIMGIGGIGGLLAGPLVRTYGNAVSLIARGARVEELRKGLTLKTDIYGDFTAIPACVEEDPAELGIQDIILVCVKNGGLEQAAKQLLPIVGPETIVLPVMNGVTAGSVLREKLGKGIILESVIYTVSSLEADHTILQKGKFTTVYCGAAAGDEKGAAAAQQITDLCKAAGIDFRCVPDVQSSIWMKYILNCAYNVMTARWACTIGDIKNSEQRRSDYYTLMNEAMQVGLAAGVKLPEDMLKKHMERLDNTTDDSTSSLSRDFDIGRVGEMEVFSGDVVRMAARYGIQVPVTESYYKGLLERAASF